MNRVAFLGLGRMGWPMAANLANAGRDIVVWNRTRERAIAFSNEYATGLAESPADAARQADVVITMLADDPALAECFRSEDGILAGIQANAVAVDMGTSSPDLLAQLCYEASERDAVMLDAPVSGSVAAATAASLTIMVAGEREGFERVEPILAAMGQSVFYLGGSGNGSAMKLAINTVLHALNCAVSEALVLAERAGIDRLVAYEIFCNSAIAAPFVQYRRETFERPGAVPVAFRMALAEKDLRLALDLAKSTSTSLPQAERNRSIFREAMAAGFSQHDESAVAEYLRILAAPK